MVQVFVDLDGVLADFDQHYENTFGVRSDKLRDNVDWKKIRYTPNFFANIPPMADMEELWKHVSIYNPIILTGVPSSIKEAAENKKSWVRKHLGSDVEVRCCRSSEKCLHASPGDVLIDDWEKYMHLWVGRNGHWITHTSAANSIVKLEFYLDSLIILPPE